MLCLIGERETRKIPRCDDSRWERRDVRQWSTPSVAPPIHVLPRPNESFESLVFRVGECNALGSFSRVLRVLGAHCEKPSRYCYQHLSPLLGVDPYVLAAMVPAAVDGDLQLLGHQLIRHRHLVRHTTRLCPLCVSERGYGSLEWTLAPFAVCADHGVYLVDRCVCRPTKSLSVFRFNYFTCRCGADLRNAAAIPASPAAFGLAKEVRRRFRQEPSEEPDRMFPILKAWPHGAHFGDFLDLLICLGNLARGSKALGLHLSQAVHRLDRTTIQLENAAHVLSKWRGGFAAAVRIADDSSPASQSTSDEKIRLLRGRAKRYISPLLYRWMMVQRTRAALL